LQKLQKHARSKCAVFAPLLRAGFRNFFANHFPFGIKSLFFLFILLALPPISFADEIELKIKGVGLSSTLATVKSELGKPISEEKIKADNNCSANGEQLLKLTYSGLEIRLSEDNSKTFKVIAMRLTSAKWKYTNGITIGSTQKQVVVKFGPPEYIFSTSPKMTTFNYIHKGQDLSANFIFRNKKLVTVEWSKNGC
jgi:hypothetical protein